MKKLLSIILLISLLLLTACAGRPSGLISADSAGKGAAAEQLGFKIAALLSNSNLAPTHHPNGELGGDADLLRQVKDGDISYMICQPAPAVSFIPELAVFDLPMLFAGYDAKTIDKVLNGPSKFNSAMQKACNDAGYQLLGFMQAGTYRLTTSNTPLYTLEDFEHLQIRTMENNNHMRFWSAIGAEPTPLAWAEVYVALQQGVVNAQENAADTCVGAKLMEVQDYLCCTNHILYVNVVLMNKELYDSLRANEQNMLTAAVKLAIGEIDESLEQIDADSKASMTQEYGMTLIEYDDAFIEDVKSIPQVQDLYAELDESTGGLVTLLTETLEKK